MLYAVSNSYKSVPESTCGISPPISVDIGMPLPQLPPFRRELPRGSNLILTLLMNHLLART